jgi:DNA-binding NtrC family response regulator
MQDQKRVLIVDDDEHIREAVRDILESTGYCVDTASDGKKALWIIEKESFQIILCDVVMQDMDGMEFLRRLRKVGSKIPVVIMSGNQMGKNFFKSAQLLGARASLLKPFAKSELLDAIEKVSASPKS